MTISLRSRRTVGRRKPQCYFLSREGKLLSAFYAGDSYFLSCTFSYSWTHKTVYSKVSRHFFNLMYFLWNVSQSVSQWLVVFFRFKVVQHCQNLVQLLNSQSSIDQKMSLCFQTRFLFFFTLVCSEIAFQQFIIFHSSFAKKRLRCQVLIQATN